ncbi:MAG: Cytochrome c-type biogenesis protein CcmI [Candidatus Tokpelaia sp. JSC161]|nr:MAG: Cytochrome c-type biogenesis protein CcmI [Candidatus Tokpelaia sp. JSC161]
MEAYAICGFLFLLIVTAFILARKKDSDFFSFLKLCLFVVPLISLVIYIFAGSPQVSSHPFSFLLERDPITLDFSEKLVRAEVLLTRNRRDSYFLENLATLYLSAGLFQKALDTYRLAIVVNGKNATRMLGYALALTGVEEERNK